MSFDFPFVSLFGVRQFCYYPYLVLLVDETEVPGETTDLSEVADKHYHIKLYRVHLAMNRCRTHNSSDDYDSMECHKKC